MSKNKNIIWENRCKSYGNHLRTGEWRIARDRHFRESHYYGDSLTIQVSEEDGGPHEHTSLITNYNGIRYQRNYGIVFSGDHSVKMICARFQRDILTNKFKNNVRKN